MKVLLLLGGIIIGTATPKAASNGIDHHENISLELFAKEPMVVDPVAISFAANGDAFVVEMRDYPYGIDGKGKPGVRLDSSEIKMVMELQMNHMFLQMV